MKSQSRVNQRSCVDYQTRQRYANSGRAFSLNSSGLGRFLEGDQAREQLSHVDAIRRDSTRLDGTKFRCDGLLEARKVEGERFGAADFRRDSAAYMEGR